MTGRTQRSRTMPVEPDDLTRLVAAHRTLGDARLSAVVALAQQEGVPQDAFVRRLQTRVQPEDMRLTEKCLSMGATAITRLDVSYPRSMTDLLGETAPPVLYALGELALLELTGVGIVGMRQPTDTGLDAARRYARAAVSHGFSVVSGNARGVDAAAHGAALLAGGATIVFPPSPAEQYRPAFDVPDDARWLMLTPYAPGSTVQPYFFLRRNELVAAHACVTVVAETGARGGTLNTVSHLRRLGRLWFVTRLAPDHEHHRPHASLIASGGIACSPTATARIMREVTRAAGQIPAGPRSRTPDLFPSVPQQ